MQTTEKFQMNLFENEDPVLAEGFNENTLAAVTALAARGIVVTGSYVGDQGSTPQKKTLTFEKTPYMLAIIGKDARTFMIRNSPFSHVIMQNTPTPLMDPLSVTWGENSVTWGVGRSGNTFQLTDNGKTFYYMAILME